MANYDQQANFERDPLLLCVLISTQHYSLFQIAICLLWRQTPLIKDVFHPASYTVDHSLSGVQAKFVDCAHVLCNLQIAHMCYAISRLPAQSRDSESAQRNLEIAQILRLRGTYICRCFTLCVCEICPLLFCLSRPCDVT